MPFGQHQDTVLTKRHVGSGRWIFAFDRCVTIEPFDFDVRGRVRSGIIREANRPISIY